SNNGSLFPGTTPPIELLSPCPWLRKKRNTLAQNKPTKSATNPAQNPTGALKNTICPQKRALNFDETNPPQFHPPRHPRNTPDSLRRSVALSLRRCSNLLVLPA